MKNFTLKKHILILVAIALFTQTSITGTSLPGPPGLFPPPLPIDSFSKILLIIGAIYGAYKIFKK